MRRIILPAVTLFLLAAWILLVARLAIADVWDETGGLSMFFQQFPVSFDDFLLKSTRPVPLVFMKLVFAAVDDPESAWRLLRAFNAACMLGSVGLMLATLRHLKITDDVRRLLVLVAWFVSGAVLITATWFANIYDAMALILIWTGIFLLAATDYEIIPALLFGVAFFCKETAILVFPFVFMLGLNNVIDRRRAWVTLGFTTAIFILYFFLFRQRVVALGGPGDIHGFKLGDVVPSLVGWLESFWWQNMKRGGPTLAGALALAISLLALRNGRLALGMLVMLLCCAGLYLGMVGNYQDRLLTDANFMGRLYLIPFSFFLFLLAFDGRRWAVPVLLIPLLVGGYQTARDHARFQHAFRAVYDLAATRPADHPLTVQYGIWPGAFVDQQRHFIIGRYPHAEYRLEVSDGRLDKAESRQ